MPHQAHSHDKNVEHTTSNADNSDDGDIHNSDIRDKTNKRIRRSRRKRTRKRRYDDSCSGSDEQETESGEQEAGNGAGNTTVRRSARKRTKNKKYHDAEFDNHSGSDSDETGNKVEIGSDDEDFEIDSESG